MAPELLAELGEKDAGPPELVAVVEMPDDDLDRITAGPRFLGVVLDRPASPGNVGSIIRLGGRVRRGRRHRHRPRRRCLRPPDRPGQHRLAVRPPGRPLPLAPRGDRLGRGPASRRLPVVLVAADEHGETNVFDADLTQPVLLLVGNETAGLTAAWRDLCDRCVRIPIAGAASSLNAANAATTILYEIARQRLAAEGSS